MSWKTSHIKILEELWGQGKTAREIAEILGEGFSRNSVIGKAHRLQLHLPPSERNPVAEPKPKQYKKIPRKQRQYVPKVRSPDEKEKAYDKVAIAKTNLDTWLPSLKTQMQNLGLQSLKQLWQRVSSVRAQNPEFFGELDYDKVSKLAHGRDVAFTPERGDYNRTAHAIALAFGKTPEDLFGPIPPKEMDKRKEQRMVDLQTDFVEALLSKQADPFEFCVGEEFKSRLERAMQRLNPNQRYAVTRYFGLQDTETGLLEIAKELGVTRSRSQQIVAEALEILAGSRELRIYANPAYQPIVG